MMTLLLQKANTKKIRRMDMDVLHIQTNLYTLDSGKMAAIMDTDRFDGL